MSWSRSEDVTCIYFKTTVLKSAVSEFVLLSKSKSTTHMHGTNEEYSSEFWLPQSCNVAKWNLMLYLLVLCAMQNKQASITNIY